MACGGARHRPPDSTSLSPPGKRAATGTSCSPDLPGCVTAGRSLDKAPAFAGVALASHVQGVREDGEAPPAPSGIEEVVADPESAGALFYLVPLKTP